MEIKLWRSKTDKRYAIKNHRKEKEERTWAIPAFMAK